MAATSDSAGAAPARWVRRRVSAARSAAGVRAETGSSHGPSPGGSAGQTFGELPSRLGPVAVGGHP
ncbi:hypothetical protein ACWEOR_31755, partial [Micromonospora chalcea]